jgi:hypothetical protein
VKILPYAAIAECFTEIQAAHKEQLLFQPHVATKTALSAFDNFINKNPQ